MANPVQDPGFELDSGAWVEDGGAQRTQLYVHSGSWAEKLVYDSNVFPPEGTIRQSGIDASTGYFWRLRCWGLGIGALGKPLELAIDLGAGWISARSEPPTTEWKLISTDWFAGKTSAAKVSARSTTTVQGFGWIVDDFELEVYEMALTKAIRAALVSDLSGISGCAVIQNLVPKAALPFTATVDKLIQIHASRLEDSEIVGISCQAGEALRRFPLTIHTRSATPDDAIEDLEDDIKNAIEVSTSATLHTGGVLAAYVRSADPQDEGDEFSVQTTERRLEVLVPIHYTPGTL